MHPELLAAALERVSTGHATPEVKSLLADLADVLEASCDVLTAARLQTSAQLAPAYSLILQARALLAD